MQNISQNSKIKIVNLLKIRTQKKCRRKRILKGFINRVPKHLRNSSNSYKLVPPNVLSIKRNFQSTISFFRSIKSLSEDLRCSQTHLKSSNFEFVLDDLEEISVSCALIFAAELDRLRRICGFKFVYTGDITADTQAMQLLENIGFFSMLQIDASLKLQADVEQTKTLIPLISGTRNEPDKIEQIESQLQSLFDNFQTSQFLYEAISEAITNVRHHAYTNKFELEFKPPGKRWWSTACLDNGHNLIRIFVYDQGHGIPRTIPISGLAEHISKYLKIASLGILKNDAQLLEAALEYGRSRTEESYRGKGFHDMVQAVTQESNASMRVLSGGAEVTIASNNAIESTNRDTHIGGTLIEWSFPFSVFDNQKGN